jgi:hypothetical protein
VPQRFGGIRLSSPIELEVFEGDRRLGSSATGIVSAPAGRHELDLVNSVLGFRSRRLVDIKGGQVVSMAVVPPNGRISINALPWAEVLIDGKLVGETPIGIRSSGNCGGLPSFGQTLLRASARISNADGHLAPRVGDVRP